MDKLCKMTNIYNEIIEENGLDDPQKSDKDAHTNLRNYYRRLLRNVLNRDVTAYKDNRSGHTMNYVPVKDAPIVKEILVHTLKGQDDFSLYRQWLNGSLGEDYKKKATLYRSLLTMLNDLRKKELISIQRELA